MNYVTLYQVKQYIKLLSTTVDDEIFNNWITWSCGLIDWWKSRRFDVYKKTLRLDTPVHNGTPLGDYNVGEFNPIEQLFSSPLFLNIARYDILEIIQLLNGDATEILSTQYLKEPANETFINRVVLKRNSNVSWLSDADGEYRQAIALTAFCGYNTFYPFCFVGSGEDLASDLSAVATLFTVSNANGQADDLISPRLQVGQMLRMVSVNGTEFMLVLTIEADDYGHTIGVKRAFNGTTAVIHPADTEIEVYRPDGDIVQMALRLTQWRYRQKDQDNFDKTYNLATQVASTPSALPSDVRMILGARKPVL